MSDLRLLRSATLASMGEEDFRRAVRSVAACSSMATDDSLFGFNFLSGSIWRLTWEETVYLIPKLQDRHEKGNEAWPKQCALHGPATGLRVAYR